MGGIYAQSRKERPSTQRPAPERRRHHLGRLCYTPQVHIPSQRDINTWKGHTLEVHEGPADQIEGHGGTWTRALQASYRFDLYKLMIYLRDIRTLIQAYYGP